jgi:hypothetical protein
VKYYASLLKRTHVGWQSNHQQWTN